MTFQPLDREGAYTFVSKTLVRLAYRGLDKPSKTLVKRYLAKTTGYSRAQLTRLIRQHRETAKVVDRRDGNQGRPFRRVYTPTDIRLLARVDADLGQMSGLATRVVLQREHRVFGDRRFERLAQLSASHLYNLRRSRTYRTHRTVFKGTKAATVAVGERRAPQPAGRPGFLRVDTVHQGDRDGAKGVYLINLVDQVTQYEFIGAVEAISERFLGHDHIPRHCAALVDTFTQKRLSPYLNYHRPCLFATERKAANGRIRRVYRPADVRTPYAKLRSLPDAEACLKHGITFAELDALAHEQSDLQAARALNAERARLFQIIANAQTQVA